MNDFAIRFQCYQKARKHTIITYVAIVFIVAIASGIPVIWYLCDLNSIIGAVGKYVAVWLILAAVANMAKYIFRPLLTCFYKKQIKKFNLI